MDYKIKERERQTADFYKKTQEWGTKVPKE